MRRLETFWWRAHEKIRIGTLAQGAGPRIVFEWDKGFLASPVELSPISFRKFLTAQEMRLEPFQGLAGLFADHVPDGFGRLLLKEALANAGFSFDDVSPLDYLRLIGDTGMGALTFEPTMPKGTPWALGTIDLDVLERGVEPILNGSPSDVFGTFLEGGASPNGARPKILAKEFDGRLYVGDSALKAPEWLIKFRAPEGHKDTGKVEYLYSRMAETSGLLVPETKLFTTKRGSFFASRRFDRDLKHQRIHMHTLSGLLNVSPINYTVGYDHFAKVTMALTQDRRGLQQVYRLAIFNVLACNQDDHTRNVAFLMNHAGQWSVAPAYDLTFHQTRAAQHKMPVMGNGAPSDDMLLAFGLELGFTKKQSREMFDEVQEGVSSFPKLAKELDLSKREWERIENVLGKRVKIAASKRPKGRS